MNFKGVMLCDRPPEASHYERTVGGNTTPFVAAVRPQEQLGLQPIPKKQEVRAKKKESHMTRHKKLIKAMQAEKREKEQAEDEAARKLEEKRNMFAKASEELRGAILEGAELADDTALPAFRPKSADPAAAAKAKDATAGSIELPPPAAERTAADGAATRAVESKVGGRGGEGPSTDNNKENEFDDLINDAINEARGNRNSKPEGAATASDTAAATKPAKSNKGAAAKGSKGAAGAAKPAWAQTEAEADENLDLEAEELLGFADGLDFDKMMEEMDEEDLAKAKKRMEEAEEVMSELQSVDGEAELAAMLAEGEEDGRPISAWKKEFIRQMNAMAGKDAVAGKTKTLGQILGEEEEEEGAFSVASKDTAALRARRAAREAEEDAKSEVSKAESGWDTSTRVGKDDKRVSVDDDMRSVMSDAEDVLRENPELKGIHSKASVRAMLVKETIPEGDAEGEG